MLPGAAAFLFSRCSAFVPGSTVVAAPAASGAMVGVRSWSSLCGRVGSGAVVLACSATAASRRGSSLFVLVSDAGFSPLQAARMAIPRVTAAVVINFFSM